MSEIEIKHLKFSKFVFIIVKLLDIFSYKGAANEYCIDGT